MNRVIGTPRYAHAEGHTSLCFSENGEYIITCGSDGDVRMYKGIEDDDVPAKCVGEKAFAVVQKNDKLYVGSDHNYVQILTFPDGELDGILTRFTASVNTIDVSKDGSLVAAGSSDASIHVVDVTNSVVKHLSGHKAPILHVTIDPKMEYLASSSCDGNVRIWKMADQTVVKEWPNVIKCCNSFHNSESLCSTSWEPATGRLLAVPFDAQIKLIQRSTWNVMLILSNTGSSKNISLTSWSNCGRFLAASTVKGEIFIWNTMVGHQVSSYSDSSEINISAFRWHPDCETRQIAYCDVKGQLSMLENCYPVAQLNTNSESKSVANGTVFETSDVTHENFDYAAATAADDDDDDDPDTISLEKIKANYSCHDYKTGGSAKGDDDEDVSSTKSSIHYSRPIIGTNLQSTFQPTSTPVHLRRRFMVFNDIGYVRQTNTEEENMIDVDFHDASIHHAFRINNLLNHTMAALNSEALVLACEKSEDWTSKLICRMLKSWDRSKEWSVEMAPNENIETIAIGSKWIAVVTSLRFLRLFSLSGIQREIICLPGPVLSANASEDLLIVVYHSATGLPGDQNLSFAVYQITNEVKVLVAAQPLPLMPNSILKWVGFSDQLNPCVLDSDGVLKLFSSGSGLWKPICFVDSQVKDVSDHYFVIGVSEERQNIRCILCKGSYYPSTTPHPFISEISWQIPICEASIDKGSLEEKFWRYNIAKECLAKEDKKLNKEFMATALKLFALSCRTNHEMRVFELCDIANQEDIIELAIKYAAKINNNWLVDRLSELRNEQRTRSETLADDIFNNRESFSNTNEYCARDRNYKMTCSGKEYLSQELFPEKNSRSSIANYSQEFDRTHSLTEASPTEYSSGSATISLIELTKKKNDSKKPCSSIPTRKINPFRKTASNDVTIESSDLLVVNEKSENSHRILNYNQKNLYLPFPEWFKVEEGNLTHEFGQLEKQELTKVSVQKYKSLKASSSNAADTFAPFSFGLQTEETSEEGVRSPTDSKKRKSMEEITLLENSTETPKKKPSMKLQEFRFTKK